MEKLQRKSKLRDNLQETPPTFIDIIAIIKEIPTFAV